MGTIEDYIQIMIDSLKKKSLLLDRIISKNKIQTECLKDKLYEEIDWDSFNIAMTEKEAEIERINDLDKGFQSLYDRIGSQLKDNKEKYSDEIKQLQTIIVELEAKSVSIRASEEKNRAMIEKILSKKKKEIRQIRKSLNVVSSYYQTNQKSYYYGLNSVDEKK